MGARPLARIIDNKIKSPLSRKILFGELKDGGTVLLSIDNDEIVFNIGPAQKQLTKAERKAMKRGLLTPQAAEPLTDNDQIEVHQ
jgi:hypothetical protein